MALRFTMTSRYVRIQHLIVPEIPAAAASTSLSEMHILYWCDAKIGLLLFECETTNDGTTGFLRLT